VRRGTDPWCIAGAEGFFNIDPGGFSGSIKLRNVNSNLCVDVRSGYGYRAIQAGDGR
jgi:hypothetical protein